MTPYECFFVLLCLSVTSTAVEIQQTIPENDSTVCCGEVLQYTCFSSEDTVGWLFTHEHYVFKEEDEVNKSIYVASFLTVLTENNGSLLVSTATDPMVSSAYDDTIIECIGGSFNDALTIDVADGPADCSKLSVVPLCQLTANAENSSENQVLITLSTTESLMCVTRYLIQFNGENRTVPVNSPSAEFSITVTQGEPFDNEIVVYTLDYENRIGQTPCVFNSSELSTVENFDYTLECGPKSLHLIATFNWMEPKMLGSCLVADVPLEYTYYIEFNNSQFANTSTKNASYKLSDVPQGMNLKITITPALHSQGLMGSPLSSILNIASITCTTSSSLSTSFSTPSTCIHVCACTSSSSTASTSSSSPTPSPDPVNSNFWSSLSLLLTFILLTVISGLVVVCVLAIFMKRYKKCDKWRLPGMSKEAEYPLSPIMKKSNIENQLIREYCFQLFRKLTQFYEPVANELLMKHWITESTLGMMHSSWMGSHEKACLLVEAIEERFAISGTSEDFTVLCEILYKDGGLRELRTELKEEYERRKQASGQMAESYLKT